jgi:Fic family protein
MVLVWEPITDLLTAWSGLTDGELGPLLQFWNDQRIDLEQRGALKTFKQELAREWSIETGQIEGVYQLDRGITQTLIEKGISADFIPTQPGQKPSELIAAIIQDHADVLEGLFQFVKGERPISKGYIHELHAALLRHQDTAVMMDQFGKLFEARLIKGKYKDRPNNPKKPDGSLHQYCPPEQVDTEMEQLLSWHIEHEKKGVPVEVEAAWLHHRFTQIHPYQDGNGRVARTLASLLFIRAGWFPVVVTRDDRSRYLDALEVADEGDLRSLISFFAHVQKRELMGTMRATADARTIQTVDEAIAAAGRLLRPSNVAGTAVWAEAQTTADQLMRLSANRLAEVASALRTEIAKNRPDFVFVTDDYDSHDYGGLTLPYEPNVADYDEWQNLQICTKDKRGRLRRQASIQIGAHSIGSKLRGFIGIVAVFEDDSNKIIVSKELFQTTYAESYEAAARRFRPWLEESLVNALTMWRKSL